MTSFYKGFTLIESLLVLFVISVFLAVPTIVVKDSVAELEVARFFECFEKSMLATQQAAILENKESRVDQFIVEPQSFIRFKFATGAEIVPTLYVPEEITMFPTENTYVAFSGGVGTNSRLQTITFDYAKENKRIKYHFLFGKGHYDKEITTLK